MDRFVYAFDLEESDGEIFFAFHAFPEIISSLSVEAFNTLPVKEREAFAEDAVLTALQAIIAVREALPAYDNPDLVSASGFVDLSPLQAMKLELYRVYLENCSTIAEFARRIEKQDTTARRLLKLTHRSTVEEIEEALAKFGIKLIHRWATTQMAASYELTSDGAQRRSLLSAN